MWCTIINMSLLVISSLFCVFAGDWIYGIHRKWFPISREASTLAIYSLLGLYEMFVLVFNLVPYIAFVIVG